MFISCSTRKVESLPIADLPSLLYWGMPHLILRVHDKAVNPRLATFHLLITQPAGIQSPKLSSAVVAPPAATPPAAPPVMVGLIRFTGDVTRESSMAMEDKVEALKKAAHITTLVILVILIDSGGGASAEGKSLAALLLQRSCIKKEGKV